MSGRPEFLDNQDGRTLAAGLSEALDHALAQLREPPALRVATGYFDPGGYAQIADRLEQLPQVQILLGAPPEPIPPELMRRAEDPRGARYDLAQVRRALDAQAVGLRTERDLSPFEPGADTLLRRLVDWLRSEKVQVRRYPRGFVHGKAFLLGEEGVIAGSSNFTGAGLSTNLELNLGHYQPSLVAQVRGWFEDLWERSEPFDLAALYEERFAPFPPWLVYLRMLWERYGDELSHEAKDGRIPLTGFQKDGLARAQHIMGRYGGVMVADGVGLGKSFLAGELMRIAVQERRQRVLLVAPATLRDGIWAAFASRHQIHLECISFEELAADRQLGGDGDKLKQHINDYALIVVDEAHGLRNPDTDRARALRRLVRGTPRKDVLLLTATPVNNSLWDLYYQLLFFVHHDAVFADRGVRSLRERFKEAEATDPESLSPQLLFDVLDAVVVRRTRRFVREYYPYERIRNPDGSETPVVFPEPQVVPVRYQLGAAAFFAAFQAALAPAQGPPLLSLARYVPGDYLRNGPGPGTQNALLGLLRSALLKRFESSGHAFARTCEKMAASHDAFLGMLDRGVVPGKRYPASEWPSDSEDVDIDDLLSDGTAEPAADYDEEELRAAVEVDRDLLRAWGSWAGAISQAADPKLAALRQALADIAHEAAREGRDPAERQTKGKVLVFSYFADTVDWIARHLEFVTRTDPGLAAYRGRIASVTGERGHDDAVFGFAPLTSDAPAGRRQDRYDVLVTTDVLAEGVNLQQCRHIINYDLPWNPMRLVQRHGRIDRIGSPHPRVWMRCFFPDDGLESLLDLEGRILTKVAKAAASVGQEGEVIPGSRTSDFGFGQDREEIERLARAEPDLFVRGGEEAHARSGEAYRQELRMGLQRHADAVKRLPWAAGSGFVRGADSGWVFCAKVLRRGSDRVYFRFVPLDRERSIVRDTLGCLRVACCIESTPRDMAAELQTGAYAAWERARADIWQEWTEETDPKNLQPRVRPMFRQAADHLRIHRPPGIDQKELDRCVDALEAPWGMGVENALRREFAAAAREPVEVSRRIVRLVHDLGLEPPTVPDPLPEIDEEEVRLVCWVAVAAEERSRTSVAS